MLLKDFIHEALEGAVANAGKRRTNSLERGMLAMSCAVDRSGAQSVIGLIILYAATNRDDTHSTPSERTSQASQLWDEQVE